MRTKPIRYNDTRPAGPIGIAARVAPRIGARFLDEARKALLPTIYFFISFNCIVLTNHLLVAQYLVGLNSFMLAALAALVVGKAVLVANKMPWLRRYDRAPLIQPILFKTGCYWVVVLFARLLEHFGRIKAMTERGSHSFRVVALRRRPSAKNRRYTSNDIFGICPQPGRS